MLRVPLMPTDIAEPRDIVDAARKRRGGELARIDLLLLHSPALTEGWNALASAIRTRTRVVPRLRELVTIAVSVLMRHDYEVQTHKPHFLQAGGTESQFAALADVDAACENEAEFDATDRAALALAVEMCRSIDVTDATFARIQTQLGDTQCLVELVGIIATYNMTNRFQRALGFG
jgi:alkylhydroperoxidase family enzyme